MKKIQISNNLIISSGVIIINTKKQILLIKPKGLNTGHFSFPKGMRNIGESLKQTALRESYEEVGIKLEESDLGLQYVVNYFNGGILTKRVFCYLVRLSSAKELEFTPTIQEEEVDFCKFYSLEESKKIIFWRYKNLLDNLYI